MPCWASSALMVLISASRGTLDSTSLSSVSNPAAISGKAAFLAPPITISPDKGRPPRIRMLSTIVSSSLHTGQGGTALTHVFAGFIGIAGFAGLVPLEEEELANALIRVDLGG